MNINRNNYEEYFLLYIDNELSATEKNTVEAFVAANPDLGEELVMLQQSIVKPEAVEFAGKNALIKPQAVDDAIEEKLLLLLDNELPEAEKKDILLLAANNIAIKEEWELLQQAKLSSTNKIIFEEKPSLYKKERKVVPIAWWRMAAAAMLIGFGLWGTVSYINRNNQSTVASSETAGTAVKKDLPVTIDNVRPQSANDTNKETAAATTLSNDIKASPVKSVTNISKEKSSAATENNNTTANNDENNTASEGLDNINNNERNKRMTATVTPETNNNNLKNTVEITSSPVKNEYAVNASFSNSNETAFETFDEEEEKPKRTKLGGFFKKVKRQFERKTKIKTGSDDEVRIANMSFAMH